MKTWHKVGIGLGAAAVLGGIVLYSVNKANQGVVTVQTSKVATQDLVSLVTASGEIKPTTYTNVTAQGFGRITEIVVKEGQHVKKGDTLLLQDNIQQNADVEAQSASLSGAGATMKSLESAFQSVQGEVAQAKADAEKSKLDSERAQNLYRDGLISKEEHDRRRLTFESDSAKVEQKTALVEQRRAELEYARWLLAQGGAMLRRAKDVLGKTTYTSPINGIVSYLPVRVGEYVVPGIQNTTGSFLMTISDMSVVTSEVKVDETDIVNVKMNQEADVTIDAVPGKVFKGRVTQIGSQAVLRSSGLATTQSTTSTQEAKDFKVVITLEKPPDNVLPGLSSTAKIKTAEKKGVVAVPIQALAVRTRKDLEEAAQRAKKAKNTGESVTLAAPSPAPAGTDPKKEEIQGVFIVRGKKAVFTRVETGITGVTDIEVKSGLKPGDEIVTGSYKALRTLKPEADVKVDNSAPKKADDQQG